jgi:hypothetical protein
MAQAKKQTPDAAIAIQPIKKRTLAIKIYGTAPLLVNAFSEKAKAQIHETQAAGQQAKSKKKREPKDFQKAFRQASHVSTAGWYGFPASAFRAAAIDVCRLVGFKMTIAKLSIWVDADGFDKKDGMPLVKLDVGEPEYTEMAVRNATGVVDLRARPMWRKWGATVRVSWDADQFSEQDVVNLLERAGCQAGLGEGRPNSKNSFGMGYGTFTLVNPEEAAEAAE